MKASIDLQSAAYDSLIVAIRRGGRKYMFLLGDIKKIYEANVSIQGTQEAYTEDCLSPINALTSKPDTAVIV
jgi:hypothetical protein